jgi:prepilin-type processing-associated H-X9-DG protein
VGNYVAIGGAVTGPWDYHDPTGKDRACSVGSWGMCIYAGDYKSSNGVFWPGSSTTISMIVDGTSNTILLGEQSDKATEGSYCNSSNDPFLGWYEDPTDLRAARGAGIWSGDQYGQEWKDLGGGACSYPYYSGATVTIRWPLGTKQRQGDGDGMGEFHNANRPLQSAHTGGVNVLRADGGVSFLNNSTTWSVLQRLAIRDDGLVISE